MSVPSSLPVCILGHGRAQCRLWSGHSLPRPRWQEDKRRLLAGPPPCGVHLEHGKASMTHSRTSAVTQPVLRVRLWLSAQIISHPNNLFEIMSKEPVKRERNLHNRVQSKSGSRHANTRRGVFPAVEDSLSNNYFGAVSFTRRSDVTRRLVCWTMNVWTW